MLDLITIIRNFITGNFEAIVILVIGAITLYYNRRTQEKQLRYNAQIKTYENISAEASEIRGSLNAVINIYNKIMKELGEIRGIIQNPDNAYESKEEVIQSHYENIEESITQVQETMQKISSLIDNLETNVFASYEIAPAIKALRLELSEINHYLLSVNNQLIYVDFNKIKIERIRGLDEDVQRSNEKLNEFSMFLDDLTVILQNNLTAQLFKRKRDYRNISQPRRVLTGKGIEDRRLND